MEKKTMGTFLSALRRASGMTQKELAERLNVSDKSVSRWERDEGAPDLSLIPAIAELFGITCDELLRGERAAAEDGAADSVRTERGEKQRRRLLAASLSKFRARSMLSAALSLCGFLLAVGCNSALERALFGFFLGAVFFVAAAAVEALQVNAALLAVHDDDLTGEDIDAYRRSVALGAERTFGIIWVLFAMTLPLLLAFRPVNYNGFTLSKTSVGVTLSWYYFPALALLAALVWALAARTVNARLLKKGFLTQTAHEEAAGRQNRRLRRITALALCAALGVSFFVNRALVGFGDTNRLAEGTTFTDFDEFGKFMQQKVEPTYYGDTPPSAEVVLPSHGSPLYYEEDGTPVYTVDEGHTITDENGLVLCYFIWRNRSVVSYSVGSSADGYLPVTVYTQEALSLARARAQHINTAFYFLYALETAAALAYYMKKRAK